MNIISLLYTEGLFRPLFNLLIGITNILPGHAVGWAIIFVTIIVRLILLPSFLHQARAMQKNQEKMKSIQVQLEEAKKKHKDDKAKHAEETMRIYKEAGVNPATGCLPLIIQLPILIALYRVFFTGLAPSTYHYLYSFVAHPTALSFVFFGLNLNTPSLLLGCIAGGLQFIQMKFLAPQQQSQPGASEETAAMMASMQKNMMYIFPAMTIFIALRLPAALALYWAVSTLFGITQQIIVRRSLHLTSNLPNI
ncbi:MAG TPA: YidC/Oxa1 family membrane protein insertase [Candidatus Andersenbacteria bacterium]|nr:YidC/Oxa1 family membrane protein insertase [Candidatus Andersenbacteria bacterium]